MMASDNPYNWSSPTPKHTLERKEVSELAAGLCAGQTALIHAGRGMGKTITLRAIETRLQGMPGLRSIRIDTPEDLDLGSAILQALDIGHGDRLPAAMRRHVETSGRLVILIDELDAWVSPERRTATRVTLNQLAKLSREEFPGQVGILAAGGIGNLLLSQTPWGSIFSSRLDSSVFLLPFEEGEILRLAQPLLEKRPAMETWLAELSMASGGIPLLACRVLQAAWDDPALRPIDFLSSFVQQQRGYLQSIRSSIRIEGVEEPLRLLELIQAADGKVPYSSACEAVGKGNNPRDSLDVLVSAGLVHRDRDTDADPWLVRPNPSVLRIVASPLSRQASPWDVLRNDIEQVCGDLRRHAADMYHGSGTKRTLVPEATISAMVSMLLRARGWEAEREAQRGAGRIDVLVSGRNLEGHVIVEVKIWPRNDFAGIEDQLASYSMGVTPRDRPTVGLFGIVVTNREVPASEYADKVGGLRGITESVPYTWIRQVNRPDGCPVPLIHHLVRLPVRKE